jgi:CHAT domain-containing protein
LVIFWAVNDAATANLMANYDQKMLGDKLNPVAALRAAQLEMWCANWQPPYYWAALTIQGDW